MPYISMCYAQEKQEWISGSKYMESWILDSGCVLSVSVLPCPSSLRDALCGQWLLLQTENMEAPDAWVLMRAVHALSASQSKDANQKSLLNTLPR